MNIKINYRAQKLLLGLCLGAAIQAEVVAETPFVKGGKASFVVSRFAYALGPDAAETGACPDGMSLNNAEVFAQTAAGKRLPQESEVAHAKRVEQTSMREFSTLPSGKNVCMSPEEAPPDPNFRTVKGANIAVDGIDMDGVSSTAADTAPGYCAHDDFVGANGGTGIDNQFYRLVGCSRSFQSVGQSNGFDTEMLAGSWGILISLSGIDDIYNDDEVEVGIFASADPLQLSPAREPLPYATYALDQDKAFQGYTRGKIKDGVLITEPTDVRFHVVVNSMRLQRPLQQARLQVAIADTGLLEGYLAGYTPVEAMYDMQYGYRNGTVGAGQPAPDKLKLGTANGAAFVLGYTCAGAYQALYQLADATPDPQTGKCTAISTQYRLQAIPAFVVDIETRSSNDALVKKGQINDY